MGVSKFLPGDFKARHRSWGDKSNAQGEILNYFMQQDLTALNDGEPTFTCTDGIGVIDLVICSANLHRHFCGLTMDYYTEILTGAPNRGHYPVISSFAIAGNRSTLVKRESYLGQSHCIQNKQHKVQDIMEIFKYELQARAHQNGIHL